MITFYRARKCPHCDNIEDMLQETSLAHKTVVVGDNDSRQAPTGEGERPPLLIDDGKRYQGSEAIRKRLEKLEEFKKQWYKFQSDACYCDDEGNIE